jgi:hypothetical protein
MDPPCPIWLGQHHQSAITVAPANTAVAAIITLRVMFSDQQMKMAARKMVKRVSAVFDFVPEISWAFYKALTSGDAVRHDDLIQGFSQPFAQLGDQIKRIQRFVDQSRPERYGQGVRVSSYSTDQPFRASRG